MRLSTLSLSLLFTPALLAQRFPEIEPNDLPATAQLIAVGTQIDANLVAAESDWYRFVLTAAARIRMHTSNTDTRIALCDATGTTYLGIDDDARTSTYGYSSDITMNLAAGTYTVQVVGFGATTAGPYSMEVARITTMVYNGTEVEPNDTHLTATPTGALGSGARRFHGNIGANTTVLSDSAAAPVTPPVVLSGTAAASATVFSGSVLATPVSTTTSIQTNPLQPMANPLLASYLPGMSVLFTSGVNVGLSQLISSNTGVAITTAAFPAAPAGGDTYNIVTTNTTAVTWVGSLPLASLYIGSGYNLRMTSGANVGLSRLISANTGPSAFGSAITTAVFPVANAPGDTFDIDCIGSTTVFRTTSALTANAWNPTTGGLGLGNFQVRFTSGANLGLIRQISGNTGASITLQTALSAAPAAGDTFVVEQCDVDYWQIVLTAPFSGIWFQINEGDAPWVFGHRYELFNASGNALLPASSLQLPAFGTQAATCSTLVPRTSSARVWPAGTYYIEVRSPTPTPFAAATVMPNGFIPTGNYLLEIFTMPMDTGGTVTESEPVNGPNSNNTAATAQALAPGQVGRGNVTISTGTDPSDWWGPVAINGPVTVTYQVRRFGTATPMLDSTLNLRDTAGNLLVSATGGNVLDVPSTSTTGLHGRVTVSFSIPAGNVFFEVISPGATATQAGDYELEISAVIPTPYVPASYAIFAANTACGVAPFPTLTRQFTSEVPALGTTFSRQLTGCPPTTMYFHFQGLSTTTANGGTVPLPYDLTPQGAPGCTVNVDPVAVFMGITDATGMAELQVQVPGNVNLRGFFLFEQAMVQNATANALGAQVSNFARLILGERTY